MPFSKYKIPRYTSKNFIVLLGTMLPLAVLFNSFLFGKKYFTEAKVFLVATIVTFSIMAIGFLLHGFVAIALRNSLPNDKDIGKRLSLAIPIFILMSAVILSIIFRGYEWIGFFGYTYNEKDFFKAFICLGIMNVFLTFLNEGISRFEKYRITMTETEQLKGEYIRSQFIGVEEPG